MNLWDTLLVSLETLKSHPLRSLLTLLGMIIGVGSLLIMVGTGEGTRSKIIKDIEGLGGSELIIVQTRKYQPVEKTDPAYSSDRLRLRDVEAIKNASHRIEMVSPILSVRSWVAFQKHRLESDLLGVSPNYFQIRDWNIEIGRFIVDGDLETLQKVCVLGSEIRKELFKKGRVIGKDISIGNELYTVVGVMSERQVEYARWMNHLVMVPLSNFEKRMGMDEHLTQILIKAQKTDDVQSLKNQIGAVLDLFHDHPEKFRIDSQIEIIRTVYDSTLLLRSGFGIIAVIILMVGGIGIMNLMMLSVTQRTREIGIRKAVGAKDIDILKQFLIEATMISIIGCALGIVVGIAGNHLIPLIIRKVIKIQIYSVIPLKTIGITVIFTALVGVFFGLYPAVRASKLDPSQALSYE